MATVKDTLILEDKMTQTLKAVTASLEITDKATKAAKANLDKLKITEGTAAKEIDKATREWAKQSEASLRLQEKLHRLKNAQDNLNKSMKETESVSKKSIGIYAGIGAAIGNMATGVLFNIGNALKNSIGQAIDTASDLVEVQNVVDVAFGNSAKEIDKWATTALNSYGLNELSAKQFAGTMGAMLKSSGLAGDQVTEMSKSIAGLAGDMASFYNLDPSEAFLKLRSGISGETEPLKQLGINLSEVNLKEFALAEGMKKKYSEMSQAEKTLVRYNYLMKVTADAQGDFNRTSNTFANQQKLLTENWTRFTAAIATSVLPTLANLFVILNKTLNFAVDNLPNIVQGVQTAGILVATAIGTITPYLIALKWNAITTFVTMKAQAISSALAMAGAWAVANAPILIAIALVGAVSVALKMMGISFTEQAQNIVTSFFMVGKVIQNVGIFAANMFRSIYNGVINVINVIRKLKGESPLEKKQYTQFKSPYLESAEQTRKLFNKGNKLAQSLNINTPNNSPLNNVVQNGALKTKQQGAIELKEEDIQALNELASRDFMVRYQQLSPSVTFGNVTVNENADFSNVLGQLDGWVADKANNSLNVGVGE